MGDQKLEKCVEYWDPIFLNEKKSRSTMQKTICKLVEGKWVKIQHFRLTLKMASLFIKLSPWSILLFTRVISGLHPNVLIRAEPYRDSTLKVAHLHRTRYIDSQMMSVKCLMIDSEFRLKLIPTKMLHYTSF